MTVDPATLDWDKMAGLLPAIVQDAATGTVLMLGYMNREALGATQDSGLVTFFSRSRGKLWRKGETSGNILRVASIHPDCDGDALLIKAAPAGPTCHLGRTSCFDVEDEGAAWLGKLEQIVAERAAAPSETSYTASILAEGSAKAAQKVGEEGVEVALAGVGRDEAGLVEESADLLFHLLILLKSRDVPLDQVISILQQRHARRTEAQHSA